jgi:DNA-binding response OmpR family regulator
MNVLLVEDEPRIASFVVKGLERHGYAVDHVATGAQALARIHAGEPDVIVLDLALPDVDGLDVLRRLRRGGTVVPVIILTARGDVFDRVRGFDAGADDYLVKPFAFDELLARLRTRLRRRPGPGSGVLRSGALPST